MNYEDVIKSIISQQTLIMGPVAIEEANKVSGLKVSPDGKGVTLTSDGTVVLENLVKQYEALFGRVSIEVCKEAVMSALHGSSEGLPSILK